MGEIETVGMGEGTRVAVLVGEVERFDVTLGTSDAVGACVGETVKVGVGEGMGVLVGGTVGTSKTPSMEIVPDGAGLVGDVTVALLSVTVTVGRAASHAENMIAAAQKATKTNAFWMTLPPRT